MIPFHIVVWLTYLKKRHQAAFEGKLVHIEGGCRLLVKDGGRAGCVCEAL